MYSPERMWYTVSREGQGCSHQKRCGIQSAERVRGVVNRGDVVYIQSAQRVRGVVTLGGCGIQPAERVRGVVTREDVVNSQQRGSGV